MYSLPISTYSDYWRAAKTLSTYFGGVLTLIFGVYVWLPGQNRHFIRQENLTPRVQSEISTSKIQTSGLTQPVDTVLNQRAPQNSGLEQMSRGKSEPIQTLPDDNIIMDYQLKDVQIDFPTEYIETASLPPGLSRVKENGKNGLQRQVIKISKVGTKVNQEIISRSELEAPRAKVIEQNSKPMLGEKFDLSNLAIAKTYQVEATAYSYTGELTATGVKPRVGLIAVDPKVIPLGSRVYVEGYGYAIAADTGGAIIGNRVDIFLNSERECVNWGRKPVKLYLLAVK